MNHSASPSSITGFPDEVVEALMRDLHCNKLEIETYFVEYTQAFKPRIPDAPEVDKLTAADAIGVFAINNFDFGNNETWPAFLERVNKREQKRQETADPWMANWISKTEDKPNIWMTDCGAGAFQAPSTIESINRVLRRAKPFTEKEPMKTIGMMPVDEAEVFVSIITGLENVMPFFTRGVGESTDDSTSTFRWSRPLAMVAGLGFPALRHFADRMEQYEPDWGHWARCTDDELRADVIEARALSGYPISLLRCDYTDMQQVCVECDIIPRWMKPLLALHLMKYVRYYPSRNGAPYLFVAYRGKHAFIKIQPESVDQTLADDINVQAKRTLCRILGIRQVPRAQWGEIDGTIGEVLGWIHPKHFPRPQELRTVPHLIIPPSVKIMPSVERRSEWRWLEYGIEVSRLCAIDLATGSVDEITVTGPMAGALAWPQAVFKEDKYRAWRSKLPKRVQPERPSAVLRRLFRNINPLGHEDGYWALIDAMLVCGLCREELAGTTVGNALDVEYPLVMVYPTGHTKETTTKQGKTSYAASMARILAPDIPVTISQKSSSAPAQRTMASTLYLFGTAIYDEFQISENHDHFLANAGLQAMSTGAVGGPGRVLENGPGVQLKYPLFFTIKVPALPPDVINRSISSFMDAIEDHTRCSQDEMTQMTSGSIAIEARLSFLMWLHSTGFLEKVKQAKVESGAFRFPAHNAVAKLLTADGTLDDVNAYIKCAEEQCKEQRLAADESGLSDSIGITTQFDPVWFFKNCKPIALEQLADQSQHCQMACHPVMKQVIESMDDRRLSDVIRQNRGAERSMLLKFSEAIKAGMMVRSDGWQIEWRNKLEDTYINKRGESCQSNGPRSCVVVFNNRNLEKKAKPASSNSHN